jgi:hypothetical protein
MRAWLPALILVGCTGNGPAGDGADTETGTETGWDLNPGPLDPHAPVVKVMEWQSTNFQDFGVRYAIPEDVRGLVILFHGTNGSAAVADELEAVAMLNELLLAGIGFVATSSTDRDDQIRWDVTTPGPQNVDLARIEDLWWWLVENTDLEEDHTLFTMGFSNGAQMAPFTAEYLKVRGRTVGAWSSHEGNALGAETLPGLVFATENDEVASTPRVIETGEDLQARGLDVEIRLHEERPLDPMRFLRIPGIDETRSQGQFDQLVSFGFVDADGNRLRDPSEIEDVILEFEAQTQMADVYEVGAQLRVVWCTHRMNGEFALEQRDFFLKYL